MGFVLHLLYNTTAIILGRTNYREADRILRVLTRDRGRISVIAKGSRKIKSRFGGHLEPFGEVHLSLVRGKGSLDTVTGARLVSYPMSLRTNYAALELAMSGGALVNKLAAENQPQPGIYDLFHEYLRILDIHGASNLAVLWFKLRLLFESGLKPEMGGCVLCGGHDEDLSYELSSRLGGIICGQCSSSSGVIPLDNRTIKLWRILSAVSFEQARRVSNGELLAQDSLPLIEEFLVFHLG